MTSADLLPTTATGCLGPVTSSRYQPYHFHRARLRSLNLHLPRVPGGTRTHDPPLKRRLSLAAELPVHSSYFDDTNESDELTSLNVTVGESHLTLNPHFVAFDNKLSSYQQTRTAEDKGLEPLG